MPLSKIIAFKRTTLVNAISACKLQETFQISHEKYAFVELPLEIGQYILHIGLVRYKMPIPAYRQAQAHKYAYKDAHTQVLVESVQKLAAKYYLYKCL